MLFIQSHDCILLIFISTLKGMSTGHEINTNKIHAFTDGKLYFIKKLSHKIQFH